jgi:pimeloyl-ACP methyl ester carboxylesterase
MSFSIKATLEADVADDAEVCVVPAIHRRFTAVGCCLPSVCFLFLFILLWSTKTTFLTTAVYFGLMSLTLFIATLIFLDMDMDTPVYSPSPTNKQVQFSDVSASESISTTKTKTGKNSCCGTTHTYHWITIYCCVILSILYFTSSLVLFIGAGNEWQRYKSDQIVAGVVSLLATFICLQIIRSIRSSWNISNPNIQTTGCLTCCCTVVGLPMLAFCTLLVLWNSTLNVHTMRLAPPGKLVSTTEITSDGMKVAGPTIHLYCTATNHDGSVHEGSYNTSLPTVLFLHGYGGSSLDAQSVRDNPTYKEHGIRFCSIDRPGYGWSEGYFNNNPDNFNDVAKLTLQVLQKEEITGDLILNFHSLGAYHALALSAEILKLNQKETEKSTKLWKIRGMVAVDAMVPEWYNYDQKRETTRCSTTAPLTDGNDTGFWKLIRTVVPSGGPRLLYATGFMGFSDQVNLYPKQYINTIQNLVMRLKYFDSRIVESQRWSINCGYAKIGQQLMMNDTSKDYVRLEVLVAIHGINNTRFENIASLETQVNVEAIDLSQTFRTGLQHQAIMLRDNSASDYIVPAILRVVDSIIKHDAQK